MVGVPPETTGGMRFEASIVGQNENVDFASGDRRCQPICSQENGAAPLCSGLTDILDVADDAVIDGNALGIEATIVVPVNVAVGVKIFADNRAGNVWSAIDREVSRRRIK